MQKVLLIGDSIRHCYQDAVIEELKGEFEVWGNGENNRFAKYTLNELGRIFKEFSDRNMEKADAAHLTPTEMKNAEQTYPDIIHWNNGLWDTAIVCEEDGAFTPLPEYLDYMSKILRELRKVTDKIIFATSTPVKPGSLNQVNEWITEYNAAIVEFMKKENVMINDLNAVVAEDMDAYLRPDKIHITEAGAKACAKAIGDCVREIAKK